MKVVKQSVVGGFVDKIGFWSWNEKRSNELWKLWFKFHNFAQC